MENISLEKAIHIMKTGDKFKTKLTAYMDMVMVENGTLKGVSINDKVEMSVANLGIMGKIISAKKEMVNAEKILDKYLPKECMAGGEPREYRDDDVLVIIQLSAENRDLLYSDLMGMIDKNRTDLENDGFSCISEQFHKIEAILNLSPGKA